MQLIKYVHACFVIEKGGSSLVVDPGGWSTDFVVPQNVAAIVVTHEHPDHLNVDKLTAITTANPTATIYAHADVIKQLDENLPMQVVTTGETIQTGPFMLSFTGGEHAIIHESFPRFANLGVIVDDELYYPGDSLVQPGQPVRILAVPESAPWLKLSDAMDFISAVKPQVAFPVHDAMLSDIGLNLHDRLLSGAAESAGSTYTRLALGQVSEL